MTQSNWLAILQPYFSDQSHLLWLSRALFPINLLTLAISKIIAAKQIVLLNFPAFFTALKPQSCKTAFPKLTMASSNNKPKNWSEWNNSKHFTDYSRDSGTGKFVRFTIAALLFVPIGFLAYMTTIQIKNCYWKSNIIHRSNKYLSFSVIILVINKSILKLQINFNK